MANEVTIKKGADGTIIVVLHQGCAVSRDEILALFQGLEIDTSRVTFLSPQEVEDCDDLNGTPIIIPIDEAACDSPELDEAGRHCGDAGGRVIILCGPGYSFDGLHPVADKYGTQCGWSPDQLKGRIIGETNEPLNASGTTVNRSGAKQVNC